MIPSENAGLIRVGEFYETILDGTDAVMLRHVGRNSYEIVTARWKRYQKHVSLEPIKPNVMINGLRYARECISALVEWSDEINGSRYPAVWEWPVGNKALWLPATHG
jgi:hypothetical protein